MSNVFGPYSESCRFQQNLDRLEAHPSTKIPTSRSDSTTRPNEIVLASESELHPELKLAGARRGCLDPPERAR